MTDSTGRTPRGHRTEATTEPDKRDEDPSSSSSVSPSEAARLIDLEAENQRLHDMLAFTHDEDLTDAWTPGQIDAIEVEFKAFVAARDDRAAKVARCEAAEARAEAAEAQLTDLRTERDEGEKYAPAAPAVFSCVGCTEAAANARHNEAQLRAEIDTLRGVRAALRAQLAEVTQGRDHAAAVKSLLDADVHYWKIRWATEVDALTRQIREQVVGDEWMPSPDTVNTLPEPLRRYIHDLETICDPAGDQRALWQAREQVKQLTAKLAEVTQDRERLKATLTTAKRMIDEFDVQDADDWWRDGYEQIEAALAESPLPRQAPCIIGVYCHRHEFIHGAEAEELREKMAALKKRSVNQVLDNVDARDSLAFLEASPLPQPEDPS